MLLDTGCGVTALPYELAKRLKLSLHYIGKLKFKYAKGTSEEDVYYSKVTMRVARHSRQMTIHVVKCDFMALFGLDALSLFKIVIDPSKRMIAFKKNPKSKVLDPQVAGVDHLPQITFDEKNDMGTASGRSKHLSYIREKFKIANGERTNSHIQIKLAEDIVLPPSSECYAHCYFSAHADGDYETSSSYTLFMRYGIRVPNSVVGVTNTLKKQVLRLDNFDDQEQRLTKGTTVALGFKPQSKMEPDIGSTEPDTKVTELCTVIGNQVSPDTNSSSHKPGIRDPVTNDLIQGLEFANLVKKPFLPVDKLRASIDEKAMTQRQREMQDAIKDHERLLKWNQEQVATMVKDDASRPASSPRSEAEILEAAMLWTTLLVE